MMGATTIAISAGLAVVIGLGLKIQRYSATPDKSRDVAVAEVEQRLSGSGWVRQAIRHGAASVPVSVVEFTKPGCGDSMRLAVLADKPELFPAVRSMLGGRVEFVRFGSGFLALSFAATAACAHPRQLMQRGLSTN